MLIHFAVGILFIAIGFGAGIWGLGQILTVAFFAIPFTSKLKKMGIVVEHRVYWLLATTVIIWTVILMAVLLGATCWFQETGDILLGYIFAISMVYKYCKTTMANVEEYLKAYNEYLHADSVAQRKFESYIEEMSKNEIMDNYHKAIGGKNK